MKVRSLILTLTIIILILFIIITFFIFTPEKNGPIKNAITVTYNSAVPPTNIITLVTKSNDTKAAFYGSVQLSPFNISNFLFYNSSVTHESRELSYKINSSKVIIVQAVQPYNISLQGNAIAIKTKANDSSLQYNGSDPPPSVITSTLNIQGITTANETVTSQPNPDIAVGGDYIVQVVNCIGEVFNSQGIPLNVINFSSIFGLAHEDWISDPSVYYDPQSGRWFITFLQVYNKAGFNSYNITYLMVSNTNNPLGGWRVYPLHTEPTGYAGDHPDLAITNDKIVITQNSVNGPGGGSYDKGEIILCDKAEILDNISDCYNTTGIQSQYLSVYPVQSLNNVSYTYLIAVQTYITGTQITYFNLSGPADDANVISLATVYPTIIPPIVAPQGNTSYGINFTNVGIKVLSAASYDGKMWFAFNGACYINYDAHDCTTAVTSSETDGIYMIETDTNPTLDSQAAIFAATYVSPKFYFFFPALTIDKYGDLEMIFGFSSRNDYPSLGALVLINGNFSLDYITTIKHGNSNISTSGAGFGNNTRYGDNFGASLDPANRGLAWVTGEYGQLGTNQSGTNLTINYDWATCISNIEINILKANVSMVIYNKQPVPTPSPFQQLINASNYIYSGKANSNFSNVEFFYKNGTIISSWLESYDYSKSALWWLKLDGGIPADSNVTIYMGFTSNDTNLLNQQMTGEAPQLSGVYGEYDDGANVFVNYWDFAGTSLPPQLMAASGPGSCNGVFHPYGQCSAPTINDSLQLGSGKNYLIETRSSGNGENYSLYSPQDIYDILLITNQTSSDIGVGYGISGVTNQSYDAQGANTWGFNCGGGSDGGNICNGEVIDTTQGMYTISSGSSTNAAFTYPSTLQDVLSIGTVNSTSVRGYVGYKIVANLSSGVQTALRQLIIANEANSTQAQVKSYWVRTRASPPNGIMPSVIFPTLPSISLYLNGAENSNDSISDSTKANFTVFISPSDDYVGVYVNGTLNASLSKGKAVSSQYLKPGLYRVTAFSNASGVSNVTYYEKVAASNVTVPSGTLYYQQARITNSQTTPTGAYFDQAINLTVNGTNGRYINQSGSFAFQNLQFFNGSTGGIIRSWLENYTKKWALYWLNVTMIGASTTVRDVYLAYFPNTTNKFNGSQDGEAPELSSTYAQYDDGADVFPEYWDFPGSIPATLGDNCYNYGAPSVSYGIEGATLTCPYYNLYLYTTSAYSPSIFEARAGFTSVSYVNIGYDGYEPSNTNQPFSDYYADLPNTSSTYLAKTSSITSLSSTFPYPSGYNDLGAEWDATGNEGLLLDGAVLATSGDSSISYASSYLAIKDYYSSGGFSFTVSWMRTRYYPPDGAMPSVTFGAVI